MRGVLLVAAVAAVMCLSCRTRRAIVWDDSCALSVADSALMIADVAVSERSIVDTTRVAGRFDRRNMVEFVDGGGVIGIDTAGNVTITGVSRIVGAYSGDVERKSGFAVSGRDSAAHSEQIENVNISHSRHDRVEETPVQSRRWYETALMRVGQLCCIAFLLWVLFLYLRRKR